MSESSEFRQTGLRKEILLFLVLLVTGLTLLPGAVYFVGEVVFGAYEGGSITNFYSTLYDGLFDGRLVVWFLVLSPYLVWQSLRWSIKGFRRLSS